MELEIADIFSKHITNSKFEDLDENTVKKIKIFSFFKNEFFFSLNLLL